MIQIQKTRNLKARVSNKIFVTLLSAILPFCLQGCMGVYEGGFECPPGEGIKCKSISEVNQMVDQCSASSGQCVVSSVENTKCEIPELRTQGSREAVSTIQTSEIWYSPFFENNHDESRKRKAVNDEIPI